MQQLLHTVPEACSNLGGIGVTTLYDLIDRQLLTKVKIGRRSFVTAESLNRYVDSLSDTA